jgi:hypothetical protein
MSITSDTPPCYPEYDEDTYMGNNTEPDDSTIYTEVKSKYNNYNNLVKNVDSGHKIIGKKREKLEYYTGSQLPGTSIRNAVTGIREFNMKVGNVQAESQYFKVRYVGLHSTNEPDTLYYDSPEQCERHMHCKLSTSTKKKWQSQYYDRTHAVDYHEDDYQYLQY